MSIRPWLLMFLCALLAACRHDDEGHQHSNEHPEGHDHHAEGHGHGDTEMVRITKWSERFELFMEHSPAVAGKDVELLAHVTVLDGFRPLEAGKCVLELEGPARVGARADAPKRPGIFAMKLKAGPTGVYRGRLRVEGNVAGSIEGIEMRVHPDAQKARAAVPEERDGQYIELLKEQQWGVPFATAFVEKGMLVESVEVAGTIETPPGRSADLGAPVGGRVVVPPKGLPRPGDPIRKGQLLATLAPAPASPEDAARADLAVTEADARAAAARSAVERAERLIADDAIPARELEAARRELSVAEEGVGAARRARSVFSGAATGTGAGSWRLVSPIDGTLVDVRATPGATVSAGETLFRVVDTRELWLKARVPEQDAARLRSDRDAQFLPTGLSEWLSVQVTGDDPTAELVTIGKVVDSVTRTVDVIYALRKPDERLRVGGLAKVSLPTGAEFRGIVVPRSSVIEDEGRSSVFVQADGEHFEERLVRTGPTMGDRVAVERGLSAGERVVTRGAEFVRLAARSASQAPHGHIH